MHSPALPRRIMVVRAANFWPVSEPEMPFLLISMIIPCHPGRNAGGRHLQASGLASR